jgi:hypothetical protein
MENLTFNTEEPLNTSNFVRLGDLSYFEGPLLSLFEELNSGHLYLFDWVDRDNKFNRWLIYRVSSRLLLQFIDNKISHLELFERRLDNKVYFTDIDSKNKLFSNYDSFAIESLPSNYYPNSDNFFELSDCNHFEKIKSAIINSLSKQKSENEYSIVYSGYVLKRNEVKLSYFNPISNKINSTSYPDRHTEYIDIQIIKSLSLNNIQEINSKSYSTVKKLSPQNKKQYANQYN